MRSRRALAALAFLVVLAGRPGRAHEPVVLPLNLGDEPKVLTGATRELHLAPSASAIDFGEVATGASVTESLAVTNVSNRTITVDVAGPAGVDTMPASITLAPGAVSPTLSLTWAPLQPGTLVGQVVLSVQHEGTSAVLVESLPVSGEAVVPAILRFDLPTFGESDVSGTDFGMGSERDVGPASPTFEMTITNVGAQTAHGVRVAVPGPGATIASLGVCYEGLAEASICVAEKTGEGAGGEPLFEAREHFGDLLPGASVTVLWRIVPANAGLVDSSFEVRFSHGTETEERSKAFDIAGEIIPFAFPGSGFLKAGPGGGGQGGFGAAVDPLDGDTLATLRPTGFDPRTVFSVGELDSVDLRTGGLTFMVPIGGAQPVRGPLSYQLTAVFNGHIWHRRTLSHLEVDGPPGNPMSRPLNGEYPNPIFNLGSGWSLHLGRLFPPSQVTTFPIDPTCPSDPLAFEKEVETGPRFVYVDPNGTQREFWRQLHGEEFPPGATSADPYEEVELLYARDGSYLRLRLDTSNPNRRWIEEPSGIRRLFVRQGAVREPTLPDEWLLDSIEDPYGNKVTIDYGPTTWTLRDHEGNGGSAWRSVTVTFAGWTGMTTRDAMVVTRVDLLGFEGDPSRARSYRFDYSDETLQYPTRSAFHGVLAAQCPGTSLTVHMPRLDRITLADDSAYDFVYEHPGDDRLRLQAVTLPTGATVDYTYASVWDSPPDCRNTTAGASVNGVSRRRVREVDGGVLEDRRFLRETLRTDDVPDTICQAFSPVDESSSKAPWSEQTVAVWNAQASGLSTASVHHFNIYPFDDRCSRTRSDGTTFIADQSLCHKPAGDPLWRLDSGRSHLERNLKVSHSAPADPLDGDLGLSAELYECAFSIGALSVPRTEIAIGSWVGDDVSALTNQCIRRETTYIRFEVSRAGHQCQQATAHCLRDSRLKATRTEYHDDGGRWIKRVNDDFDGLGHYRATTTFSTFETASPREEQTTYRGWNPGVGTLVLNPDHTVASNVSLPSIWLLNTWDRHWTREPGGDVGGEACFHPALGHMTHERTWATTDVDPGDPAANRSSQDVVVRHAVDAATGELEIERFFGADTYDRTTSQGTPVPLPTDNGWCNSTHWQAAWQDYAIVNDYAFGVLHERRVDGDSVFEVRRSIDQATGWPATETRDSGAVITFDYDPMGRMTWATSQRTASQRFEYQQLADGRWQLTGTVYPKGTTASTPAPSPIRIYQAQYDGLGRLRAETFPRFDDNPSSAAGRRTVTRSVRYQPSGAMRTVSALDNPSRETVFEHDFRGRVVRTTQPDGVSKSAQQYSGVRRAVLVSCVETGGTTVGGICGGTGLEKAETVIFRDWKGRTVRVEAPLDDQVAGGFETTFTFNARDQQTSARRTHLEEGTTFAQLRSWTYDGRGFLTGETIPERTPAVFSSFTTRGSPRTVVEHTRMRSLVYDRMGRLRASSIGGRALKRFVYCDPQSTGIVGSQGQALCNTSGGSNGQLIRAIRNNYRAVGESGLGAQATWVVESDFHYDAAGRTNRRDASVFWGFGWSSDPLAASPATTFTQTWAYDDLGNVTALGYPTCNTTSPDCTSARTVSHTYGQGFFLTGVVEGSLGATLTYHPSGLRHQVQHLGGGGTDVYGVSGGMPRIASIDLGVGSGQRFDLGSLTYDFAGNITAIGGDVFSYDLNSRLTDGTVQGISHTYAYDNFDNHRGPTAGTVFPGNNRLIGGDWLYDAWGNLKSGAGHVMVYDELDKLAGLHEPSGASLLGIYDHDDLRILTWREGDPLSAEHTWTLRNGLHVIREYVGLGSAIALRKDYVHAGARLIASKEYPSGDERHYHEDQVGNARLITGSDGGRVHYAPFGEELLGSSSGERAVGFQGHENDGLTTYMRGRTYLPFNHRFLQVDPARDSASWSQYAFVANNPIHTVDPSGLAGTEPMPPDHLRRIRRAPRAGGGIPKEPPVSKQEADRLVEKLVELGKQDEKALDERNRRITKDAVRDARRKALRRGFRLGQRSVFRSAGRALARFATRVAVPVAAAAVVIEVGFEINTAAHNRSLERIANDGQEEIARLQVARLEALREKREKSE